MRERKDRELFKGNLVGIMLHRLETVALTKRQEADMEVAELKMLQFSLGVTRMDKIRNEYIRGGQHRWDGLERKHERQD